MLVSSVAYELVEEAVAVAARCRWPSGSRRHIVFYLGDRAIDRLGGAGMGSVKGPAAPESGLPIVLGAALDGVWSRSSLG